MALYVISEDSEHMAQFPTRVRVYVRAVLSRRQFPCS